MMDEKKLLLNRSHANKKVDNFYVEFFRFPDNSQNYLGKQLKQITRPNISFDMTPLPARRGIGKTKGRVRFAGASMSFFDDENGLTSMLLYAQVMQQARAEFDSAPEGLSIEGRSYRFDIKVELYNARDEAVEGIVYKDCFITEITHSESIVTDSTDNEIQVGFEYDDVDFLIMDRYQSFRQS